MVKNALLLTGCFILAACNMGMDNSLGRTPDDPFVEIPRVQSFNGNFSIVVSWSWDEAADEYYLYRAADDLNPQYTLVYSGPLTEYEDFFTLPHEDQLYLYRLGKRRGEKLFVDLSTRGKAALGVVSGSRRDFSEPNDDREHATVLDITELFANSWFYGSNTWDDLNFYDEDWYCIDIPPHWVASIILTDLDSTFDFTDIDHFKIETWGRGSEKIVSRFIKEIANPTNFQEWVYFRIYPDYAVFQQYHPTQLPLGSQVTGSCGKIIRYTIRVTRLSPE
jgi:hypothetical protein